MVSERIQVNYTQLAEIARHFDRTADDIDCLCNKITTGVEELRASWSGQGAVAFLEEMDGLIFPGIMRLSTALSTAGQTTARICQVARQSEIEASQLFKGEGGQVLGAAVGTGSVFGEVTSLIDTLDQAKGVIDFLKPLGAGLLIAPFIKQVGSMAVIDLPDALGQLFSLRGVREAVGLPGHLNNIYNLGTLPNSMLKVGLGLSIPVIGYNWVRDLTQIPGTRGVSAGLVDTGLTLLPVAGSWAGAVVGGAVGTFFFPGPGTAAGIVAGVAASQVVVSIAVGLGASWVASRPERRNSAIDWVDNNLTVPAAHLIDDALHTTTEAVASGVQNFTNIFSPTGIQ